MGRSSISILGAGLAGLSAAWHLQQEGCACHVFEKQAEPGGLCCSRKVDGFTFDCDGHLLHFRHKQVFDLVNALLDGNLVRHRRNSWVYCEDRLIRYPFQANLFGLSRPVLKECLTGFIKARRHGEVPGKGNFLEWIEGVFGHGIARHFMVPYNTKFWTVHPREMTAEWLDGFVPLPTMERVIDGAIHDSRQLLGYNSHFWYPRQGGIGQLAFAFSKQVRNIHTGFMLRKVDLRRRRLIFDNGETREFDDLISTIPLPELGGLIGDIPADVARAFKELRWNSILNVNFGLRQKWPSSRHWIYFPQEYLSFFRVGFFHNFSKDLAPPDRSSLYVEISYSKDKPLDRAAINSRIEADLRKVGILDKDDIIECRDINDIHYGYPLYDSRYATARRLILDFLHRHKILTCGRYGGWQYMSMEDVILDGKGVARRIVGFPG